VIECQEAEGERREKENRSDSGTFELGGKWRSLRGEGWQYAGLWGLRGRGRGEVGGGKSIDGQIKGVPGDGVRGDFSVGSYRGLTGGGPDAPGRQSSGEVG
jgi:hypothetical protein